MTTQISLSDSGEFDPALAILPNGDRHTADVVPLRPNPEEMSFLEARAYARTRIPEFTPRQQELFEEFGYLPDLIAHRVIRFAVDFEDAVADGNVGLVKGVFGFDPDKVPEWATNSGGYFYSTVEGHIMRGMRTRYGRTEEGIRLVKPGVLYSTADSLDRPVRADDSNGEKLSDTLGEPETDSSFIKVDIWVMLEQFSAREKEIISRRLNDETQQQIADAMGISQMHVSRILRRIGNKLKTDFVEAEDPTEASAI